MTVEPDTGLKLIALAYHEAAHAVVGWLMNENIRRVTVIPESAQGTLGHVEGNNYGLAGLFEIHEIIGAPNNPEVPGGYVVSLGKGPDGELKWRFLTKREQEFDKMLERLAMQHPSTGRLLSLAAGEAAQKRVDADGFHPANSHEDWRAALDRLYAFAMLEGIGIFEARRRIREAVKELLEEPLVWEAVTNLADALIERRELTGREAVEVMRRVFRSD